MFSPTFQKDAAQSHPGLQEKLGGSGVVSDTMEGMMVTAPTVLGGMNGMSGMNTLGFPAFFGNLGQPNEIRLAQDRTSRFADLSLVEEDLVKNGKHVLVAFFMAPRAGCDYLATAAQFAAGFSTGTNANVCTIDTLTESVDPLVYHIDIENESMKIAFPCSLFDRGDMDGRALSCPAQLLSDDSTQGMGNVECGVIIDFYLPPSFLKQSGGPACNILNLWRNLGRGTTNGGLVGGTFMLPTSGL